MLGSLFSIAAPIVGGLFNRRQQRRAQDRAAEQSGIDRGRQDYWNQVSADFSEKQFSEAVRQHDLADSRQLTKIRNTVSDAKAAGLHPLFALGGSASYSPSSTVGAGSPSFSTGSHGYDQPTGSALGKGLADAAKAAAALPGARLAERRSAEMHQANLRVLNAQAQVDEMQAAALHSQAKRAELKAMTQGPATDGVSVMDDGTIVRKYKPGSGKRNWKVLPRENMTSVEYQDNDGNTYRLPNPDVFEDLGSPSTLSYLWQRGSKAVKGWLSRERRRNHVRKMHRLHKRARAAARRRAQHKPREFRGYRPGRTMP